MSNGTGHFRMGSTKERWLMSLHEELTDLAGTLAGTLAGQSWVETLDYFHAPTQRRVYQQRLAQRPADNGMDT